LTRFRAPRIPLYTSLENAIGKTTPTTQSDGTFGRLLPQA